MNKPNTSHPNGEQLLRYADGELPANETPAVRAHLEACWQCRTELEELHKTINDCVRYRSHVLQTNLPSPPAPWGDIDQMFTQAEASLCRPAMFSQWRAALSALFTGRRKWFTASLLLGVAFAAATLRIHKDQPVITPGPAPANQISSDLPKQDVPSAPALSAPTGPTTPSAPLLDGAPQAIVPAATAADELRVFVALHLVGADLGEPVQVSRSEGRIHIQGTGIEPHRQSRILAALNAIPNLDVHFNEVGSNTPQVADFTPAAPAGSNANTGLQEQILRQLGTRAAVEQFTNQLMERSDNLMARAHAVRRLAQRFPPYVEATLGPDERKMLLDLRRQHIAAMELESEEILRMSRAALPANPLPAMNAPAPASWQASSDDLFQSSRNVERALAVGLGAAQGDVTAAQLFTNIARIKASVEAARRLTASE
jgi:anti-sigma factor RsiW